MFPGDLGTLGTSPGPEGDTDAPATPGLRRAPMAPTGVCRFCGPRPQDLHPQEAPGALLDEVVSQGLPGKLCRAADARSAAAAPEPQRGAARSASWCPRAPAASPSPPRRVALAKGRLSAGRPRGPRGRAQVPGTGCGRLLVWWAQEWRPGQVAGAKRGT